MGFPVHEKLQAYPNVLDNFVSGHGKGPWDGVGAVIKRLLRQLEKTEINGAADRGRYIYIYIYIHGDFDSTDKKDHLYT